MNMRSKVNEEVSAVGGKSHYQRVRVSGRTNQGALALCLIFVLAVVLVMALPKLGDGGLARDEGKAGDIHASASVGGNALGPDLPANSAPPDRAPGATGEESSGAGAPLSETHPAPEQPHNEGGLGVRYTREAGIHLDSFFGTEPDIAGWASIWQGLAAEARLVEGSVKEENGVLSGTFEIEQEGVLVDFEIGGDGYLLTWNDEASTFSRGDVDFRSSISFSATEPGEISRMNGAVQLKPRPGQTFHREGPVGHIFYVTATSSNARAMMPSFKDNGSYGLTISDYKDENVTDQGYIDSAYSWYDLLSQVN